MEKLIELLNEYHFFNTEYIWYHLDKEENRIYFKTEVVDKWITNEQRISDEWLISKKFGFIKWLVDNDKIDRDVSINWEWHYESLLMKLAIQDNPLDFLVKILK